MGSLQQAEEKNLTLLEIQLKTGRHHQIRVQLAGHGLPIWGDARYNPQFGGTLPVEEREEKGSRKLPDARFQGAFRPRSGEPLFHPSVFREEDDIFHKAGVGGISEFCEGERIRLCVWEGACRQVRKGSGYVFIVWKKEDRKQRGA